MSMSFRRSADQRRAVPFQLVSHPCHASPCRFCANFADLFRFRSCRFNALHFRGFSILHFASLFPLRSWPRLSFPWLFDAAPVLSVSSPVNAHLFHVRSLPLHSIRIRFCSNHCDSSPFRFRSCRFNASHFRFFSSQCVSLSGRCPSIRFVSISILVSSTPRISVSAQVESIFSIPCQFHSPPVIALPCPFNSWPVIAFPFQFFSALGLSLLFPVQSIRFLSLPFPRCSFHLFSFPLRFRISGFF